MKSLSYRILGQSRIVRDRVYKGTADFVDTDNDGKVLSIYAGFRAETTDEPALTIPYAKIKEHADRTGDAFVTQEQLEDLRVGEFLSEQYENRILKQSDVSDLLSKVAPFATPEEQKDARWGVDTEKKALVFYTESPAAGPQARTSFDFRCQNTILGEASVFNSRLYRGFHRDIIDLNGDKKVEDVSAGFRRTETTEPGLNLPYAKIKEFADREGKEVLLDNELEALRAGNYIVTRTEAAQPETVEIQTLLPKIAPLASDEQAAKARWGVDTSKGTLFFFTDDVPPPEQRPEPPAPKPEPAQAKDKSAEPPQKARPVETTSTAEVSAAQKALASAAGFAGLMAGVLYSATLVGPLVSSAISAVQGESFGQELQAQFKAPVRWSAKLHDEVYQSAR